MKRNVFISIMLSAVIVFLAACSNAETTPKEEVSDTETTADPNAPLVIWTFSDTTEKAITQHYLAKYPDKKVDVKVYPLEVFQTRLDGALRTGKNLPDVVALEISFVKKYVESGMLLNLSELGLNERAKSELYGYTVDIGTAADGNLYALSSQAAPGAFSYRKSMAKELWGDDSPQFVQQKLSNWDQFLEVAEELKQNGDRRIVSNLNATQKVFKALRTDGWVKDQQLQIDPVWDVYLDQIRTMQDKGYSNETIEYSAGGGWYTDISGDKVFGYFLAAWGLDYHLKANAKNGEYDSSGDWGVIKGPAEYYDGGTWFAGTSQSTKKDEIKHLLEYLMFDQDYLVSWATKTGDFSGNKLTVEAVKDQFADDFLQGQNHYELLAEIADNISAKNVTIYDDSIGGIFSELAISYALHDQGFEKLSDLYERFKSYVKASYPDVQTE